MEQSLIFSYVVLLANVKLYVKTYRASEVSRDAAPPRQRYLKNATRWLYE
jgi:hypothetical protein